MASSKNVTLSKKRHVYFVLFLFLLQDNSHFCLYCSCNRGHKIINLAAKVLIFKKLITSKQIDCSSKFKTEKK